MTIQKQDKAVTCNSVNFKTGSYSDISLKICLPSINDFLSFIDSVSIFLLSLESKLNKLIA